MSKEEIAKNSLAFRLRSRRAELNFSQVELAKMVGVEQGIISKLERGKAKTTSAIGKLATALSCDVAWLEFGDTVLQSKESQPPFGRYEGLSALQLATLNALADAMRAGTFKDAECVATLGRLIK